MLITPHYLIPIKISIKHCGIISLSVLREAFWVQRVNNGIYINRIKTGCLFL